MKTSIFNRRIFIFIVLFLLMTLVIACSSDVTSTQETTTSTSLTTITTSTTQSIETSATIMRLSSFGEPGLTPEIFAPNFISTEMNFEFAGTFSSDYNSYFFTRRAPEETNRIYYTEFVDGYWSQPTLSPISEDLDEMEPFITPDGKTIYFGSMRDGRSEYAFYQSDFVNGSWQTPVYSENGLNQGFSMYVSVSTSGNIYFTGLNGIYVIKKIDGKYQPRVSTGVYGTHPYIAPDESYMLFDKESGTSSYIYITINQSGHWSTPVKLGLDINQSGAEQICSSVTSDGRFFFFSRFVDGTSNIFWVDATYLDQYLL